MKRVLLLGGTGAIGVYLSKALVRKGFEVMVTSRKDRSFSDGITCVNGDARNTSFLAETLHRLHPDAVVDFMIYSTHEFLDRRDLLLAGTSHYLFLSSYTVFANSPVITEESPRLLDTIQNDAFLRSDDYPLRKARCENLLRESLHKNWTIVRPGITYSQSRFQFGCLEADTVCYRSFQGKPVVIPAELLDRRTTLTWAGDVGEMISRLIFKEAAMRQTYNVTTSENHSWREVADIYAGLIGLTYKEIPLEQYCLICGDAPVLYDRMYDRVLDNSKILKVTGMVSSELKVLREGLACELERFKANPSYEKFSYSQNGLMDRLCGTYSHIPRCCVRDRLSYWRARYPFVDMAYGFAQTVRRYGKASL